MPKIIGGILGQSSFFGMKYVSRLVSFLCCAMLCIVPQLLFAQPPGAAKSDSMINELGKMKEDTNKVKLLTRISLSYRYNNPQRGIEYGAKAVALAEQLDWKEGLAKAYSALANNHLTKSEYLKSAEYYNKVVAICEETGDRTTLGKTMVNIGILYFTQANFPKAQEYYFKALAIEDEIKSKPDIASCLLNIGIVYTRQEEYVKALEYFFRSLKLAEEVGDKPGMAYNYGNIGLVYKALKNYPKALEYYEKGLALNEKAGAKTYIQADLGNIGNIYRNQHDYATAFSYFFRSLSIARELGDRFSEAITLGNIGECYLNIAQDTTGAIKADSLIPAGKQANVAKAESYLRTALAMSKELDDLDGIQEVSKNLSATLALKGDYKGALDAHMQYMQYKDSIFSEKTKLKLAGLETQREIDLKERDLQIEKLKAANRRNERMAYIAGIVLLLVAIGIILNKVMKQARHNEQLSSEKKKHLARIKEQSNVLEDFAHAQAHDIRGQVVKILGITKLFNYDNPADPVNKDLMENVAKVTEDLDGLVKEMVAKENKFNKESRR